MGRATEHDGWSIALIVFLGVMFIFGAFFLFLPNWKSLNKPRFSCCARVELLAELSPDTIPLSPSSLVLLATPPTKTRIHNALLRALRRNPDTDFLLHLFASRQDTAPIKAVLKYDELVRTTVAAMLKNDKQFRTAVVTSLLDDARVNGYLDAKFLSAAGTEQAHIISSALQNGHHFLSEVLQNL